MESEEKLSLKQTAGETTAKVAIKQEAVRLPEDVAHQEFAFVMESLPNIKTEQDLSCIGAGAHAIQQFTPGAGTPYDVYEITKTESMSDQEILDGKHDSDAGSMPEDDQGFLAVVGDQEVDISAKESETGQQSFGNIHPTESRKRMHKCEYCSRSFSKRSNYEKHLLTHATDKKPEFACPSCPSSYHTKCELARHFRIHNPDTNHCQVCGVSFTLKKNLKRHMLRKHSDGTQQAEEDNEELLDEDAASCAPVSQKRAKGQHSRRATSDRQSKLDEFSTYSSYSKELLETCECLSCSKRTHRCQFCFRPYSKKSNLNKHLKTHDAERKRDFGCHTCGKAFYTKCDLMSHVTVHTGGTFNCQVCGARFTYIRNLKEHVLRQHPAETQQFAPYAQTPNNADANMKTENGEIPDEEHGSEAAQGSQQNANEQQPSVSLAANETVSCELSKKAQPKKSHEFCERKLRCKLCVRSFKTQTNLKSHMKTHSRVRPRKFDCPSCESSFYTKRHLAMHVKLHADETYTCGDCGASFESKKHLNEHMFSQHPGDVHSNLSPPQNLNDASIQPKVELITEDEFIDEKSASDAASFCRGSQEAEQPSSISSSEQDSVSCLLCHKIYSKELIRTHMRLEHTEQRTYECEVCLQSFKGAGDLNRHLKTHAKNRKREFVCRSCGWASYTKAELKQHMRMHTGDTYDCQECGKRFTQSKSLSTHMLRHHQGSPPHCERTFKCELCPGLFSTKQQLERHSSIHDDNRPRPYACGQCGSTFYAKTVLKNHLLTHDKERKREIKCSSCEKTFFSNSVLRRHMRVHTGETVRCELCGSQYTQTRSLKKHMLREHCGNLLHPVQDPQAAKTVSMPVQVEEFIEEVNSTDSASHAQGNQQEAPEIAEDVQTTSSKAVKDILTWKRSPQHPPSERPNEIQTQLEPDELKYKCEFCPRLYKSESRLSMHLQDHAKDKKRVFPCLSCESSFYTKRGLLQHVMMHNRDKDAYNCEVCGQRFRQTGSLKNHIQRKHSGKMNNKGATKTSMHTKEETASDEEFLDEAEK